MTLVARWIRLSLAASLALFLGGTAHADTWRELFTDPQDGRFDGSRWLLDRKGFLPIPMIITEPAVGYGGGVALAFFHRKAPSGTSTGEKPDFTPPSVTAVMGATTENGTKIGGLGHLGIWRNNTVRYIGGLAAMDINLERAEAVSGWRLVQRGVVLRSC